MAHARPRDTGGGPSLHTLRAPPEERADEENLVTTKPT